MRRFFKIPIILALMAILASTAGVWRWHQRGGPKPAFRTGSVKRGDVVSTISATGTIEPVEVVDVGAQVAGLINSFGKDVKGQAIDYGSEVREGTVLAQIDDSTYAADLALAKAQVEQDKAGELNAEANLEQLKARLIQTEADWKRAQELDRAGLIPHSDYDSFKASYEIAKANIGQGNAGIAQARAATVQANAMLLKAERNLAFCTIKSPVDGVIIDRRVNIGQTVVSSLNAPSLFLIARDLKKMQIWVGVNEADVGRIVPNAPVTFACDAFPGRKFQGTVGKIRLNATMTQNVVMYTVEVNTDNSDGVLLPYLTANVRFVVRKEADALLIPNAALRWTPSSLDQLAPEFRTVKQAQTEHGEGPGASKNGKPDKGQKEAAIYVWLKDGEFVRPIEVKPGTSDGSFTAIPPGNLQEGQELVTGEYAEATQAGTPNPFLPQVRKR